MNFLWACSGSTTLSREGCYLGEASAEFTNTTKVRPTHKDKAGFTWRHSSTCDGPFVMQRTLSESLATSAATHNEDTGTFWAAGSCRAVWGCAHGTAHGPCLSQSSMCMTAPREPISKVRICMSFSLLFVINIENIYSLAPQLKATPGPLHFRHYSVHTANSSW